jgi:DUF4097 and DUF4098 domain-containing protein YvlB
MGRYVLAVSLLAVAVVWVGPAGAVTIDRDYHETFDVREGVRLELRHGDGDVTITPWEKDVIDVQVRYFAEVKRVGLGGDPDFTVEFDQTDDTVRVVGHEAFGSGVSFFQTINQHEYTYTINAPPYVRLELNGDDGDVEITGWRADIDCVLDDGDVTFEDIANTATQINLEDGDVWIKALIGDLAVSGDDGDVELADCRVATARVSIQDGDVAAKDCEGEFKVTVDDGDVDLTGLVSDRVDITGEDGDVMVSLSEAATVDVGIATDDGSITVLIPPGPSYEFAIKMDDGSVSVDIPNVDAFNETEHAVTGRVRGGEGRVRLSTMDGDVVLREE